MTVKSFARAFATGLLLFQPTPSLAQTSTWTKGPHLPAREESR
jgi:hypothetical protein